MSSTTLATIIDGVIALAIVVAATVLVALDKIDVPTTLALFGISVTLIGGSAKALLALHVPTPRQMTPAPPPTPAP